MNWNKLYADTLIQWRVSQASVPYEDAVVFMEERVRLIDEERARECIWALEHPSLYTAGTGADPKDMIAPGKFPVFKTGRGGQYTYHGPGQRVVYVMLDLRSRGRNVREFVCGLEDVIIRTLADFGVRGERRKARVGVWVASPDGSEAKIAALGIRIRRWISFHGVSININPDLSHFDGIVPCGISEHGVTSFQRLGKNVSMDELDRGLRENFTTLFGPLTK